ncbi:hypothetical protein PHYC_01851 [Phycisphaerales bacterium]|nr:hypothetical protein PHYC_01851 [Phycisphaerales bacterium]
MPDAQPLRVRPGLGFFRWPELIVMTAASVVFVAWWLAMAGAFAYTFWAASPMATIVLSPIGLFPPAAIGWVLYARWTFNGAVVPAGGRTIQLRRYVRPGIPLTSRTIKVEEQHKVIVAQTSRGRRGGELWCIGLATRETCEILAGEYRSGEAAKGDASLLADRLSLPLAVVLDDAPGSIRPAA